MKTYIYKGRIRTTAGDKILTSGCEVQLSETNKRVQSLVSQGYLELVKEKTINKNKKK